MRLRRGGVAGLGSLQTQPGGHVTRHLDAREKDVPRAWILEKDAKRLREIGQERKGVGGIDHQRCEHRIDLVPKEFIELASFVLGKITEVEQMDSVARQLRPDDIAEDVSLGR